MHRLLPFICCCCSIWPSAAPAAVTRVEIVQRLPYADGRACGETGPYERLLGKVYFAVDPAASANRQVVDLELAPRNAAGLTEFSADFEILAPVDRSKARGALLYDVNNRGNRLALGMFNTGADDFLMRQGYIVAWSGWIAEVLPGGERLRLLAPPALADGQPLTGLVRAELAPDVPAERMNITYGATNGSYEPTPRGLAEATLSWRLRESDPRVVIPREQFQLHSTWMEADGERGALPLVELQVAGGLRAGYLYELIYEARGAVVQGLGLAGIRDLVSFLKHDATEANPLRTPAGAPAATRAIGFGVSQSGRCLRMLLYDGLNADEQGRIVFEGLMPHVAGAGLGFFNHRFASPTRHNTQHDNHLFPTDLFPFAYGDETDPYSGRTDGLLYRAREAGVVPKIMHTQSSAEYWTRAGSLVHTTPLGEQDANLPPEVRVYAFGGSQHGAGGGLPAERTTGALPHNPTDYRPLLRGLLTALDAWIVEDTPPPASRYPTISAGTLAGWTARESGWQPLPGVRYPEAIHQPEHRDYGPEFLALRRISLHPPAVGSAYRVLVPACDADNNERDVLTLPTLSVPIATFTGWNLRHASIGAETELLSLAGSYVPFPRTDAERVAAGDPRRSLEERYGTFADYLTRFAAAAEQLAAERYILAEDVPRLLELAERHQGMFPD